MTNQNLKAHEKRKLLVQYIELLVFCGYDISPILGHSLSYFDYQKITIRINQLKEEKSIIDSE